MNDLTPCPECAQTYALNPSTLVATPGRRSQPERVLVPVENVWGEREGTTLTMTSRWLQEGKPVQAIRFTQRLNEVTSWFCQCGALVRSETPALERVACTHDAPEGGVCRVRAIRVAPPSDVYVNARHGASCPCCGHQGTHLVRLDRKGILPGCLHK